MKILRKNAVAVSNASGDIDLASRTNVELTKVVVCSRDDDLEIGEEPTHDKQSQILWQEAVRFVELLAGEPDPAMTWQTFDDKKRHPEWAEIRHGRLSDKKVRSWLIEKNRKGCGIYVT